MTRSAARPARMPPLPPRPGWARLAVTAAAVAATWFNMWVSFGPLRDPSRIQGEAMRGFGRESVFYTMHGNVAAAVYAALAAALAGAEAAGLAPPPPPPGGATAVSGWTAVASVVYGAGAVVLTAVTLVVGLGYYVLIHFHPAYAEMRSRGGGRAVGSRIFVSFMVLPLTLLALLPGLLWLVSVWMRKLLTPFVAPLLVCPLVGHSSCLCRPRISTIRPHPPPQRPPPRGR